MRLPIQKTSRQNALMDSPEIKDIENLLQQLTMDPKNTGTSGIHLYQNAYEYSIEIFLPGFRKECSVIAVDEHKVLSVSAEVEAQAYRGNDKHHPMEFNKVNYYLKLPHDADDEDIEAYYNNNTIILFVFKKINSEC